MFPGVLAMPDFEVEQAPQQLLVVVPAVHVLGEHLVERAGVAIAAGNG